MRSHLNFPFGLPPDFPSASIAYINPMLSRKTRSNLKSALAFGSLSKVRTYFQRHNGLPGVITKDNLTVMHMAVLENRRDVVEMAVREFGREVQDRDQWGNTVKVWALLFRCPDIVMYMDAVQVPSQVTLLLGKVEISLTSTQLIDHFSDLTVVASLLALPFKYFIRIFRFAAYRLLPKLKDTPTRGSFPTKYALRKGFCLQNDESISAFLLFFAKNRDFTSFFLLIDRISSPMLDIYVQPMLHMSNFPCDILLKHCSNRLNQQTTLAFMRKARQTGTLSGLNPSTFALFPSVFPASNLKNVTREWMNFQTFPHKPASCRFQAAVLTLISSFPSDSVAEKVRPYLPQWVFTCLHPNGCLEVFDMLKEMGILKEKVKLHGKTVNFIQNLDMVRYFHLIQDHFCNFLFEFDMKNIEKADKKSLLPAFRLFEEHYKYDFLPIIGENARKLAEISICLKGIPRDFMYYLEKKVFISSFFEVLPDGIRRSERFKALCRYSRRNKVMIYLFLHKRIESLRRLPGGLSRYICEML